MTNVRLILFATCKEYTIVTYGSSYLSKQKRFNKHILLSILLLFQTKH